MMGLGGSEPHSLDTQPFCFLLSHPPKSHARFSFGVKLNLTISCSIASLSSSVFLLRARGHIGRPKPAICEASVSAAMMTDISESSDRRTQSKPIAGSTLIGLRGRGVYPIEYA